MRNQVRVLGARGSTAISGERFARYGCATACVLLELAGQPVLLDAGSGLMNIPEELMDAPTLPLLLSHTHFDHVMGLPLCPYCMQPDRVLVLYGRARKGLSAEEQVRRLMAPPLWPVGPERLPAKLHFLPLLQKLTIGPLRVTSLEGRHPGGVSFFRIEGDGRAVVYATDFTPDQAMNDSLAEFARDCDLFIADGQYSPEEWELKKHFGHNSWEASAALGERCGAKRTLIFHHDPCRKDDQLDLAAAAVSARHPSCTFAKENEVIQL